MNTHPENPSHDTHESLDAGLAVVDARLAALARADLGQTPATLESRVYDRSVAELRRAAAARLPVVAPALIFHVGQARVGSPRRAQWPMRLAACFALLGALAGAFVARNSTVATPTIATEAIRPQDFEQAWAIVSTALEDETSGELVSLQTEATTLDGRIGSAWSMDDLLLEEGAL